MLEIIRKENLLHWKDNQEEKIIVKRQGGTTAGILERRAKGIITRWRKGLIDRGKARIRIKTETRNALLLEKKKIMRKERK